MGQNAIWLEDYNTLSELIVSTIQLNEGADKADVLKSWSGATGLVVSKALDGIGASEMTIHPTATAGRGVKRI